MRISMAQNSSYPLDERADAIAITLSEDGRDYGTGPWPFWQLDVYTKSDEGVSYLGTVNTVASKAGGSAALARTVAYAVCPGARGWHIEATGITTGVGGDGLSVAVAELRAQSMGCCGAFGVSPGVYRPLGRTIFNGVLGTTTGSDSTAPLANSRVDMTFPIAFSGAFGSNESGAQAWLMFFDATALPINGTQPVHGLSFDLAVGGSFNFVAPTNGIFFQKGLVWALSTTPNTLTVAAGTGARVTTLAQW